MAEVRLTPERIVPTGLIDPTFTGSLLTANTYFIRNSGRVFIYVKNVAAGGDCVVTVATPNTIGGLAISDQAVTISDGEEAMIGPFPPHLYNDGDGDITVTFSEITGVTIAVLTL